MDGLVQGGRIITPRGVVEGWLAWKNGRIAAIESRSTLPPAAEIIYDARGKTLCAGFIDLHVHGAMGHDTMDANLQGLHAQAAYFARHGVTGFAATTLTNSRQTTDAALAVIQEAMNSSYKGSKILGAHLEGPYLNQEKAGAQNVQYIRRARKDEARAWLDMGIVRLVALAPEFEMNHWLIAECAERGISVSAAHTAATYEQMREAVALGLSQLTHTYNGMQGLHHREVGTVGAGLLLNDIFCELIADGVHVSGPAMELVWRMKGSERLILITDATRGAGMPDGDYNIGGQVFRMEGRESRLLDGTLAGSTANMQQVVKSFSTIGGDIANFWQCTSYNAAHQLGVADRKGSLEVGKDADLVLLDDALSVCLTLVEGEVMLDNDSLSER